MIRSHIFAPAAASLLLLAVACSSVPLTAPTDSTVTMTADRTVLPLNGQSTLRAVVIESGGTPVHNGTVVTFTSTLGTVDPVEAKTVNGVATATFNAGSVSGKTSINAFSGGAKTAAATEITIGSAAAKTITVSATPSSVSQSGGTVTIAAQVLDEAGNPLPGVNVTFSSDVGQLSASSALSDAGGIARTQLTTNQTSKVTATAGAATKDLTVNVTTAPTVTITASETGTTDVPVPITVAVTAGAAATPRQVQTLTVDFGDGITETRSNITGSAGFSHTYRQARGYTITATAIDVGGNTGVASKAIVIAPAALPTVSVSASPNPVPAINNGQTTFTVTATAGSSSPLRNVTVKLSSGEIIYSGTGGGSFSYRFGGTGTYTVIATATDANGNEGQTSTAVVVQ